MGDTDHVRLLRSDFTTRTQKNSRYSMRAYAKYLGLHFSTLSRVMAGKAELTGESGVLIAKRLKLSDDESRRFVLSVLNSRKTMESRRVGELLDAPELRPAPIPISEDTYAQVARLKSLALLQLATLPTFESEPEWIAKALEISVEETNEIIEDLVSAGLLERDGELKLVCSKAHMTAVDSKRTNEIRRKLQLEILRSSMTSLVRDDFEERLHYGMTVAIDPKKLPTARKRVMAFIENLSDELGGDRSEVYQMAISVFPITKTTH